MLPYLKYWEDLVDHVNVAHAWSSINGYDE